MARNAANFVFLQILMDSFSYRMPMQVVDHWSYIDGLLGRANYPICPRCRGHIEREYQRYCGSCGQALDWNRFEQMYINGEED